MELVNNTPGIVILFGTADVFEALRNLSDPETGTGIPCSVCGKPLPVRVTEWEGEPVHVTCPDVDYTSISKDMHPYHKMIFWNEVLPCGVYARHPETSLEDLTEDAEAYGFTLVPYSDEEGSTNEMGWPLFMTE